MRTIAWILCVGLSVTAATAGLRRGTSEKAGLSAEKLAAAGQQIDDAVNKGTVGAAALLVARNGIIALEKGYGRLSSDPKAAPVRPDTIFLIASITKPVTVTGFMRLVERGRISLDDPVSKYIPEFTGEGREKTKIRNLLTHTSGLPDMPPDHNELRSRHAPLKEWVADAVRTPLLFPPGAKVSYSSMAILLAAEILERVTGQSLEAYQQKSVFGPVGMKHSSMVLGRRKIEDVVRCELSMAGTYKMTPSDWDWNSPYWRNLGAPWGGLHTTVGDIALLLESFIEGGKPLFNAETARAMITNQTGLDRPWGLGWSLGPGSFYKGAPQSVFGHTGATGTMCWADPARKLIFVMFTNLPAVNDKSRLLQRVSTLASEAAQ